MCGRLRLSRWGKYDAERFAAEWDGDWQPRYNIAPTDRVVTIRQHPKKPVRRAELLQWGLVPSWSKDAKSGFKMINARAETVATAPAFREPFQSQRCLVIADGFYEWKRTGTEKQPYCFVRQDKSPIAFAGLWNRWYASGVAPLETCTIITTTPNAISAEVHDRMPVILAPEHFELWLDPGFSHAGELRRMLVPCADDVLLKYPVSTRVNSVRNDDESCAMPVEPGQSEDQASLF